ncbi:peroxidase 63-like [Argentina anserina]|uniref:peroxidase 63-like n=1 Tax=Argentina anserina TaxID=57926 RepID=UPI0021768DC6|nr:peroxidase 63-like [Potentilla anserina]
MAVLLVLILTLLTCSLPTESRLYTNYYAKSCPRFAQIVQDVVTNKQISTPTTAAGTLRLFFHDCIHNGCDGSILVSSTPFNKAERDADVNLSLPGDGFDVVVRAKIALELACPNTVSCADILAVATRDLVTMMGGPYYNVPLGRRDGKSSRAAAVPGTLPLPTMSVSDLITLFGSRGFSAQEMVALSGAHTIGFSHCKEFTAAIYNYSRAEQSDPVYNPRYAAGLRNACADFQKNPTLSVFNDVMTPNKFDNAYFQNLPKGLGLLKSDHAMFNDARTRSFVELYAKDQSSFFYAFARAMEKLSVYGIQTGRKGEIRHRCDAIN